LANELCGVDVSFKAERFGWDVYWTQILVQRDSGIESMEDLEGLSWAYPDAGSTSGYMAALVMFSDYGITPGETVEAGGHTGVVRAIYNGEADFGTTFFSPPLMPEGEWEVGMDPDIPEDLFEDCAPSDDGGQLLCDGWRVLDARASLRTEAPDIVQQVKILEISPPIPNDTLSFGPDFPADLRPRSKRRWLSSHKPKPGKIQSVTRISTVGPASHQPTMQNTTSSVVWSNWQGSPWKVSANNIYTITGKGSRPSR
jgi:phosphonate transport system substrate-binding protein